MTMLNVERIMMKKKEGCRSASGDYHHKAWVGATLNIHSISNVHYEADDDEDDVDSC